MNTTNHCSTKNEQPPTPLSVKLVINKNQHQTNTTKHHQPSLSVKFIIKFVVKQLTDPIEGARAIASLSSFHWPLQQLY
jgi:hypothetical protein